MYKKSFTHENLISKFNTLCEIVSSFPDAIIYPDSIGNKKRILDRSTELLIYLAICRHSILAHGNGKNYGGTGSLSKMLANSVN